MNDMWQKAAEFHRHKCPGLAIGVKGCQVALEKMNIIPSKDEGLVCISEHDACGVDAIQSILGCSVGKGNLVFRITGKSAFTLIKRETGEAMRFYFKGSSMFENLGADEKITAILQAPIDDVYVYETVKAKLPEKARLFTNVVCEKCGEAASENNIRLEDGKKLCLNCYSPYDRKW